MNRIRFARRFWHLCDLPLADHNDRALHPDSSIYPLRQGISWIHRVFFYDDDVSKVGQHRYTSRVLDISTRIWESYNFDIRQLIFCRCTLVLRLSHMRHVTVIISPVLLGRGIGRIEYETEDAIAVQGSV
jgi:hypothetical protein